LIEALPCAGDPLEELDVNLQAMARLRLLVPLPALLVWAVLLVCREPLHAVLAQDAMDRGARDCHLMKALQIVGDAAGTKVVMLAKIQNLTNDLYFCGVGRVLRRAWLVTQPGGPGRVKSAFPLVEGLPRDTEMATRLCHASRRRGRPLQHAVAPGHGAKPLQLGHRALLFRR
jgi:hypothetical protein